MLLILKSFQTSVLYFTCRDADVTGSKYVVFVEQNLFSKL